MKQFFVIILTLGGLLCTFNSCAQEPTSNVMKDIEFLASDELEGRETGKSGNEEARSYLLSRFEEIGLEKAKEGFEQTFPVARSGKSLSGINLVGQIKGEKEKYIVITAHYDHIGVIDGEVHNGADDNASGTAGLLALASYFKNNAPNYNMIFVAFDAEEKGLLGAKYFVNHLPVEKEDILLNVNMDMISRNDKNEIYACGTYHYPQFRSILEEAGEASTIDLKFGHDDPSMGSGDWTFSSDHGPFHKKKIPFVYFGVEDHEDYHQASDEADKINPEFVESTVQLIIDFVERVDRS